jgi:CRP-like cAMP-binding protein
MVLSSYDILLLTGRMAHILKRRDAMPVDVEMLRQIPLFATLSAEDLAQVAAMTVVRHYDRGDLILLEGDLGGALHYVRSGLVKVFKTSVGGKEQVLRMIASGHTFNDVPALDGGPNPASAAAMEPSVVYVMRRAELRHLIITRPEVAEAVVQTLASALRHLVALVEDLSLRHVTARVAKILLDQEASSHEEQHVYHLTQQEMAALAGNAREVVGRALKELETAGAIEMRQGRAVVLSSERLSLLASGE